jgi:predicted Zn finger-like uncharacterized protein
MDVRCTRCGTEYEFDDALISERGTSVRCTQCGFQFKVFPPQLGTIGPDEWVVLTSLGRRVVYRSLRELQSGISKSEVAREDLLARGSKPPRPLGSIAELDPLFATKAAPERQPSTLTGVAPPAQGAAKVAPPPGGSIGRAGHDTFSGVAPPANVPSSDAADAPAAARPGAPMRVGGTRTVLGIGTGADSTAAVAATAPTFENRLESAPPETRSFESFKPSDPHAVSGEEPRIPAASGTQSSEPPTNRPPPPEQPAAEAGKAEAGKAEEAKAGLQRIATELGVPPPALDASAEGNTAPLVVAKVEPQHVKPAAPSRTAAKPVEPESPPAGEKAIAKVQLTTKAVAVPATTSTAASAASDPPTARWAGQAVVAPKSAPTPEAAATVQATKPSESAIAATVVAPPSSQAQPATARSGELRAPAKQPAGAGATEPPRSDSRKHVVDVKRVEKFRDDAITSPPARPRGKVSQAAAPLSDRTAKGQGSKTLASGSLPPKPLFTAGRVTTAVLLIGLGLFAGMKIVGSHLGPAKVPAPAPSTLIAAPSALPTAAPAWDTSVVDLLKIGDHEGAERLLTAVSASEQGQPKYRSLRAQSLAQSADMVWWKVQLVGKAAGDAYTQSKQDLTERLERLKSVLTAVGPEAEWPEPVQAASLDARRMHGEKTEPTDPAMLERLKRPTTDELKYTKVVLAWVRTGTPDDSTLEGLRQLRSTPIDVGPRLVALVVALTQLHRFEDAKAELSSISSQARPHPLYGAMRAYVTRAEQAYAENSASVKLDGGTAEHAEPGENDPALLEGDFRLRLTRASECLSRNELTKAQKLLRSVLAQRPNDTEAISALGDVMRRRGDLNQARELYDKALAFNGNYLPAMVGTADLRWRSGDRSGAAALYRRILERVGETPGYGQVAAARLREVDSPGKSSGDSASDSTPARDGKATTPKGDAPAIPKGEP